MFALILLEEMWDEDFEMPLFLSNEDVLGSGILTAARYTQSTYLSYLPHPLWQML
jgi:hypothetical protein